MVFKNLCVLVIWTKVASALEGLSVTFSAIFRLCSDLTDVNIGGNRNTLRKSLPNLKSLAPFSHVSSSKTLKYQHLLEVATSHIEHKIMVILFHETNRKIFEV